MLERGTEITCEGRLLIWEELVSSCNPLSSFNGGSTRLAIDETRLPAIHVVERPEGRISPSSSISIFSSSSATNGSFHSGEDDAAAVLRPVRVRIANLPLDTTEEQVRHALVVWGKLRSFVWEPDHPALILATFESSLALPSGRFVEERVCGFPVARGEGDREVVVGPMPKRTALPPIAKLLAKRLGAVVHLNKTTPVPIAPAAPAATHKSCLAVFADGRAAHSACLSGVTVAGKLFACSKA